MIALNDVTAAEETALEYSRHPDADAFEISSTLRQLVEVWQLTDEEPPGSTVLPVLRAAKLRREGGRATFSGKDGVNRELQAVKEAQTKLLEKNFGDFKTVTLKWYELGLQRARSVARIERLNGRGFGTGWLVKRGDFFLGDRADDLLIVTNAHVVNADGAGDALMPDQAAANFQSLGVSPLAFKQVVWSSPPNELDATFLEIDGAPSHLDLDGALDRRAIAAGATVSIDSDCHRAEMLGRQMQFGIITARRGWVEPRHVLNTRSLADLRAHVAAKRGTR
jgi:hypothetical protein